MARVTREKIPGYILGFGAAAVSLSLLFWAQRDPVTQIAALFLAAICVTDAIRYRIPNALTLGCLLIALTLHAWTGGVAGLGSAALGALVGFFVLLAPYALGWIGGGDVKAFTALGALVGAGDVFGVFLYAALIGGVVSILTLILVRGTEKGTGQEATVGDVARRWRKAVVATIALRDVRSLSIAPVIKRKVPYAASIALGYAAFAWKGAIV